MLVAVSRRNGLPKNKRIRKRGKFCSGGHVGCASSFFLILSSLWYPSSDAAEVRFVIETRSLPTLALRYFAALPSMSFIPFAPFIAESSSQSRLLAQNNEQVRREKEQAGIDEDR